MCASVNLSQLRLSVRRLEQEIAEPCCREERMAGGAAVNTPNTCRRKERMAGGAAVNTPNTCRRKQRRELFPSSRPDDADWLFPAPPDTLTVYRAKKKYNTDKRQCMKTDEGSPNKKMDNVNTATVLAIISQELDSSEF
ncbi:uncharacterized protein LOC135116414 isoform X2 [Scylla paramamosain]|uniref:uncharacterized protein LOC135116414 isoform X2 n=1 Tax=Scylla paramamosain TaxID=85552 RepID=UPI00308374FD